MKSEGDIMTHIFRAWLGSLTIQLLTAVALFATATQLLLSQGSHAVQKGARQTKLIGAERLVSVEPIPQMDGPMCDTDRSEEHTSELQSHSFISYAVFC